MKACLRATTILAGTVIAASAMAQTAGPKAPFTAFLDGDVQAYIGVQSGTKNNGTVNPQTSAAAPVANSHGRALGMYQNAELRPTFQGRADNGLTYGWFAKIDGASSSITVAGFAVDREDLFLRHPDYGQIQFGNNSSTSKGAFPYTQCDYGPLLNVNSLCADGGSEQFMLTDPNAVVLDGNLTKYGADNPVGGGRATHIYWASPRWSGFDFSLDYAPDGTKRNEEQFVTSTSATNISVSTSSQSRSTNISGAAVHYTWASGPWSGKIGANIGYSEGKYIYSPAGRTKAVSDGLATTEGASVQWRDIRFAAVHTWKGKSSNAAEGPTAVNPGANSDFNKPTAWGYSLLLERYSYSIYQPDDKGPSGGDWGYGVYYQFARDAGPYNTNGVWEINYLGVGGGYWIAPGLQVFSEAWFYSDWNTHPFGGTNTASFGTPANARHPSGQVYFAGISIEW